MKEQIVTGTRCVVIAFAQLIKTTASQLSGVLYGMFTELQYISVSLVSRSAFQRLETTL